MVRYTNHSQPEIFGEEAGMKRLSMLTAGSVLAILLTTFLVAGCQGGVKGSGKLQIEEYDYKYSNPFHASSNMLVHSVIRPRDTRPHLIKALRMLRNKQRPEINKRHGNIPL